jgi:hypothetical protein
MRGTRVPTAPADLARIIAVRWRELPRLACVWLLLMDASPSLLSLLLLLVTLALLLLLLLLLLLCVACI